VWDTATEECQPIAHGEFVTVDTVAIAPGGTWFAASGGAGYVHVWDTATERPEPCSLTPTIAAG
jgi:hypothetical protein